VERFDDELKRVECPVNLKMDPKVIGHWDKMRLDQVITNLLSNAIKYGQKKPIDIEVRSDESTATVTVQDHGIGIAPEDQARIFDRFERAVSSRNYGGLGLGLWIVKQIVDGLEGTIKVASEVGRGSSFKIVLPRRLEKNTRVAARQSHLNLVRH
jgi:signal transduction histidine kinase